MKIALISPYDATIQGGVTKHIAGLAGQLRRWGHQVAVMAPCSPRTPGGDSLAAQVGLINLSPHVVRFPYSGSVAHICIDPRAWWRAGWQLRHTRFDVIHVHEPFAPGIPWAVLSQARRAASAILVGTFHAYRERRSRMYSWAGPLWARGMRLLDGHIAVSSATASFWNQYVPVAFQLIPNGIDPAYFARPAEEPPPNGDEVLFIGRLEPRKGLDVLLRAWAIVEAHDPQVWLTVAGAYTLADCRPYMELAERLQLRRVRFAGPVPEMRLPAHYRRASVVCTPATGYESFGLVVLEAMAAGRPVVASNIAGYRSVMGDCLEGLLVQPNCPQAFATAILGLLHDPIRRELLGERGRCAAKRYSWETITNQILVYYDELQRQKTR